MIFEKSESVPYGTTGGLDTVAVRMPSDPIAAALIRAAGGFVSAPSANTSGRPSPTTAEHVRVDLEGKIDMILDGGAVDIGLESTILDMTVEPPMILRPGAITADMFEEVIGPVSVDETFVNSESKQAPKAPGMKYRHYAPKAKMMIVEGNIREEILAIADKYGDERRTAIGYDVYDLSTEDLIPRENTVITMTKLGYIKRMTVDNFRSQNRGGRGIKGMQTIEDDYIEELLMTTTHHYLMFFTNTGRVYRLKAYEIPEAGRTARGTAIVNLLQLMPGERITAVIPMRNFEEGRYLVMATKNGLVKKTPMEEYANVRKTGLVAITLRDDDELIEVKATDNNKDIMLVTKDGMCIRFKETDVRSTGRSSMGVRGMNLDPGDEVVAMQLNSQGDYLLVVSENGMGKRTAMSEFTCQNRGGKGVKCYKITEKTGNVIGAKAVNEENEIMMITTEGIIIRITCAGISILGRITSGVKLINLDEGVTVASLAKVREKVEENANGGSSEEPVEEADEKEN